MQIISNYIYTCTRQSFLVQFCVWSNIVELQSLKCCPHLIRIYLKLRLQLQERLEKLENQTVLVSAEDKERIRKTHEQSINLWRKRKRMCMDALGLLFLLYWCRQRRIQRGDSTPPPSPLGSVKSMVFIFLPKRVLTAKPHPPKKEKKDFRPPPCKSS